MTENVVGREGLGKIIPLDLSTRTTLRPMVPILTLPFPPPPPPTHPIHTIFGSGIERKFNDIKYGIVSLRNDKGTSMNDKKKTHKR